ncbi:CBS domain-containing protein [Caulobacter sp. SLTY]|uniref:CBS domain-containing protein n=1 Tax=Caulobacter sp. SLTY TaxID=2683262 RepID=UPI001411E9A4|nr:CBS domain-containing protein [Caulobacter sp. SLTY]NBB17144.1 CBS domain-containing protein [Caulobacter sp. SLTY]
MRVADLMTPVSEPLTHETTLRQAANALANAKLDQLPVAHGGRLIGAVSQSDLVDFGLARGLKPDSPVFAVMSHYIDWCYEDEDVVDVTLRLADADRESLIVLTRDHRFAGVVAANAPARGGWGQVDGVEAAA